ncbi:MAG: terephthalate 1,2-dioxygenase oxygenase component beta chain [Herminiimonas sp.]|nr:terephthalate 1,2-dioxygenase oxygenase component beta chain [Herminiimonas sp.]
MTDNDRSMLIPRLAAFMEDYARCLDKDELERWPGFFAEQCIYKVTTYDNMSAGYPFGLIYADSRGMLHDRVKSLREANIYEGQRYRHIIGQPFVVQADGTEVRAETSFIVVRIMRNGETALFATGSYRDTLKVDSEGVALVERVVVCDSSRIDTLLALPL